MSTTILFMLKNNIACAEKYVNKKFHYSHSVVAGGFPTMRGLAAIPPI
jgi:hypothetical protein